MPSLLSQVQRDVVETLLRHTNCDHEDIVKNTGISLGQIRKMSSNLKKFDAVVAPKVRVRGKPPALSVAVMEVLFFSVVQSEFLW